MENKSIDFTKYTDDELKNLKEQLSLEIQTRKEEHVRILIDNFNSVLSSLLKNNVSIIATGDEFDMNINEHTYFDFVY